MFANVLQASTLAAPGAQRKKPSTPLPTIQQAEARCNNPNFLSSYRVCLEFEAQAVKNAEAGAKSGGSSRSRGTQPKEDSRSPIIYARILGYLLYFTTSHQALADVVRAIHSCNTEGQYEKLGKLGEHFFNFFIREFRKHKGRTPATSEHPSRPSFETQKEFLLQILKEAPTDHTQAKQRALLRDGYRCVVTRKYDGLVSRDGIVSDDDVLAAGGLVPTECAHIVPDSTFFNVKKGPTSETKENYSASVLAVLQRVGYDVTTLNGEKVHALFNVMTLEKNIHDFFDRLEFWFEQTKIPNQYRPTAYFKGLCLPETVTFTSPDPDLLPLPSPELLALHALCAKVAHMSGAAGYLDEIDRDLGDLGVLAPDGTSSAVLHHAIWEKLGKSVDVGA